MVDVLGGRVRGQDLTECPERLIHDHVDDVTGNMSGPNIDIRSMSSCVPCRRQRVESAGVRCIGQEP